MKKTLIAGAGVAAFGLAVLPLAGVFADSVTDIVQVTISSSCTIAATSGGTSGTNTGRTYSTTLSNGGTKTWAAGQTGDNGGGVLTINCNNASGWNLTAVGASELVFGNDAVNKMAPDATGKTPISTGTSGDNSYWAFQVTGEGTVEGYNSFSVVPTTATKVAESAGAVSAHVINTGYTVHVSNTQQAGTYTGKVTYTLTANN